MKAFSGILLVVALASAIGDGVRAVEAAASEDGASGSPSRTIRRRQPLGRVRRPGFPGAGISQSAALVPQASCEVAALARLAIETGAPLDVTEHLAARQLQDHDELVRFFQLPSDQEVMETIHDMVQKGHYKSLEEAQAAFVSLKYSDVFNSPIVHHAFANAVVIAQKGKIRPKGIADLALSLSSNSADFAEVAPFLKEVRTNLLAFMGESQGVQELAKLPVTQRAKLVGMTLSTYDLFVGLWKSRFKDTPEAADLAIYYAMKGKREKFAKGVREAADHMPRKWGSGLVRFGDMKPTVPARAAVGAPHADTTAAQFRDSLIAWAKQKDGGIERMKREVVSLRSAPREKQAELLVELMEFISPRDRGHGSRSLGDLVDSIVASYDAVHYDSLHAQRMLGALEKAKEGKYVTSDTAPATWKDICTQAQRRLRKHHPSSTEYYHASLKSQTPDFARLLRETELLEPAYRYSVLQAILGSMTPKVNAGFESESVLAQLRLAARSLKLGAEETKDLVGSINALASKVYHFRGEREARPYFALASSLDEGVARPATPPSAP
jgi:hypothetical protein